MHFKTNFDTYDGGKGASGTYQTIINQIPPHDVFISGFLGNCAITRYKKPAPITVGIDPDPQVIQRWSTPENILNKDLHLLNNTFFNVRKTNFLLCGNRTFIYLDPPYLLETRTYKTGYYKHELTREDHQKLIDFILLLTFEKKVNIAISTYPNKLYEQLKTENWRVIKFDSNTRRGKRKELLYMNYSKPEQLHDYTHLGNDYREREQIKKKHNSMIRKIKMLPPLQRKMLLQHIKNNYDLQAI